MKQEIINLFQEIKGGKIVTSQNHFGMQSTLTLVVIIVILGFLSACRQPKESGAANESPYATLQKAMLNPDTVLDIDIAFENIGQSLYGFNEKFQPFKNLKALRISGHALPEGLPKEVAQLKKLEVLDLRMTSLDSLPKETGELLHLKKLVLASNGMTRKLPDELGNLVNLEWLDVGFIRDTTMTRFLCKLKKLQYLNIEVCGFRQIPPCVMELKELKVLNAPYNFLRKLPDNIGDLEQLEELVIYKSSFVNTDLEIEKLKTLVKLQKLSISDITEKQEQRIRELLPNVEINNIK